MHYMFDPATKEVRTTHDVMEWAAWVENSWEDRRVGYDEVGNLIISTVFLTTDHSFGGSVPILFETMIFDRNKPINNPYFTAEGYEDVYMERYATYDQAFARHQFMVDKLEGFLGPEDNLEIESRMLMIEQDDF